MPKEKKYVKVESESTKNDEIYGKDKHGKIIKIEQTGAPQERATVRRVFVILFWIIAIVFEVI
jgi:hypothetical protein